MSVKSTRLRFLSAGTPDELSEGVSALPFKVEIKGQPVYQGSRWHVFFVIPDNVEDFGNVNL